MPLLLLLLTFSTFSFAKLSFITVENLDATYEMPEGHGVVDKVNIGLSLTPEGYPISIKREENSLDIVSPFLNLSWMKPWKFIHDMESFKAEKTSLSLGGEHQFLMSDYLEFKSKGQKLYKITNVNGKCQGLSEGKFEVRILESCKNLMTLSASRIDMPVDFILYKVLDSIFTTSPNLEERPVTDLSFESHAGEFYLRLYLKYLVTARLRAWGHIHFENEHKTIAIRVDKIKFGYFPVTSLVMKKLKELIKSPNVKIDPPWIRIDVKKENENQ